ncbi:hypothetical protein GGR52DRAFT_579008 [Hypoxylon sp. FL1284]|nr:hypothetical protein GGR52DRAFT_579008 [Hypoxylon sp. FL1284]
MSTIDRLYVTGVRSFSPFDPQSIRFQTPLTLIVGYNGSGKTTIIECLKYATTGELPPNSKGGAFIHDPKLCGEREVRAQVQLRFKFPPDTIYCVTRNLQLTMMKSKRSQKTLEGSLKVQNSDDRDDDGMILKNVDLNKETSLKLGDDSLWPMSEPSVLKKQFDEIFEAMKYTKAIENMKLLRKKQGERLREYKILEGQEKVNKVAADKCNKEIEGLQAQIEGKTAKYEEVVEQRQEAEENARDLKQQANSYLNIVNELESKRRELGYQQRKLDETKSRMNEMNETDDWLRDTLAQYEKRVEELLQERRENIKQYNQYEEDLKKSRHDMNDKLAEKGMRQSEKATYERQVESRIEHIHDAAKLHSIRGFEGELDDDKAQSFQERIQKLLTDKQRDLEKSKTAVIHELEGQKSQSIAKIERQITTLQRNLNSVDIDEGTMALLESSSKKVEGQLTQASREFQDADFDSRLRQEKDKLDELNARSFRLRNELKESTALLSDRAELDLRKKELAENKRKLDTLSSTYKDKLCSVVSQSWEPSSLEREFEKAVESKTHAYEESARERDKAAQQLEQVQVTLSEGKAKAKKQTEEMERCKSAVFKALEAVQPDDPDTKYEPRIDDLSTQIENVEEEISTLDKDLSLFGHLNKYYVDCQEELDKHNRCKLCDRGFTNVNEKSRVLRKIREALQGTNKDEIQNNLDEAKKDLATLQNVRPQNTDREIRVAQESKETMIRNERQELESISKAARSISRTFKEIEDAEAHIERLMSQQQASGGLESYLEQAKALDSSISKLSNDKLRLRELISNLELEQSQLKNDISEAVRKLEKKKDYKDQIQEQRDEMSKQRELIQEADKQAGLVEPEITKARAIKEDVQQRGRAKEKKVIDERDGLAASINELKLINNDIQDYLSRGGPSLLAESERATQSLEKVIKQIEKEKNDLTARTNKIKEESDNSESRRKNIIDNLSYRETLQEIKTFKQDIDELESRNANEDYERFDQEAANWESTRQRLNAEATGLSAAMGAMNERLDQLYERWRTDYENADHKYREAHIKVETTKAAIDDLGKYSDALNNAIMQYHALKMEEVNRIAGELWQSTYQGTDIDTILIKSDSESATGRSQYNYRVCMVKQDTEMDMRGRCSAGQKVLASIIIRLALAESFGAGCGIIALDEPTTNLDSDNIRSLAHSLHAIIDARKAQANFQLIVITHDEDFLRHMRCSDFCDYYYRVRRNDRQNSVIERQSIASFA